MRKSRHRAVILLALVTSVGLVLASCGGDSAGSAPTAAPVTVSSKLIVAADMVQGSKNIPQDQRALKSCVLTSRFPRNSEMVWRVRVTDPKTGEVLGDQELTGIQVSLANGTNVDMKWGPHPKDPPNEFYWTGSWVVPKDAPTGTLGYTITATAKDGRTGEWKPFIVTAALPAIIDEVLPDAQGR